MQPRSQVVKPHFQGFLERRAGYVFYFVVVTMVRSLKFVGDNMASGEGSTALNVNKTLNPKRHDQIRPCTDHRHTSSSLRLPDSAALQLGCGLSWFAL